MVPRHGVESRPWCGDRAGGRGGGAGGFPGGGLERALGGGGAALEPEAAGIRGGEEVAEPFKRKISMKSELKTHVLQKLADAYSTHELKAKPEYQRGTVWKTGQRQGLIDSLLRGYQIPLFFVHVEERQNAFTDGVEKTAWIVDGQQRMAAIVGYLNNEFSLPDPDRSKPGSTLPAGSKERPGWTGLKFAELTPEDRTRLLETVLHVIEMSADSPNEVRDLFIRLQAGTPLTAQEKRDAWPGEFTNFVIKHAGKPGHPQSNPKRFFSLFPKSKGLSVDDGVHYVDGLAESRKFFAGLAMTIMVRERTGVDFVDVKGTVINDFYMENLELRDDDPAAMRVVSVLDLAASLPEFERFREGRALSFQWAFHLALLVDALAEGDFTPGWRQGVVDAFLDFKKAVAEAQLHYRQTKEMQPHYTRFGRLLSGSGSDTADIIRSRHAFLLSEVHPKLKLTPRDPHRLYDSLEREVIWNRDRGLCQNPECARPDRKVSFKEANIHHITEHTSGGPTTLKNGILVCVECHGNRAKMKMLRPIFEAHIERIYSPEPIGSAVNQRSDFSDEGTPNGNGKRLEVLIDWGALDVDRKPEVITCPKASEVVVRFVEALIVTFGKSIEDQLLELPVLRYPLSRDPNAFLNPSTGETYRTAKVGETGLYICLQSSTDEKQRRLSDLIGRLTLPDGSNFPDGSIEVLVQPAE